MKWNHKGTKTIVYDTDTVILIKYTNAIFVLFLSADLVIFKAGYIIQVANAIIRGSRITNNKFVGIFLL